MIETLVQGIRQEQKEVQEQIRVLQAKQAKLERALNVLGERDNGGSIGQGSASTTNGHPKRHMSASARARISAYQKARWDKIHAEQKKSK
jgi:hypothetical protein